MFKCECGNSEFTLYRKQFVDLKVDGEGNILDSDLSHYADELSETMECTECGLEHCPSEIDGLM